MLNAFIELDADWFIAAGTVGLAAFTCWLAWGTRKLALAAGTDQRTQWRPVLIAADETVMFEDGVMTMLVKNVGRGPAFGVHGQMPKAATIPGDPNVVQRDEVLALRFCVDREIPGGRGLRVQVAYYDIAERWHKTHFTVTTPARKVSRTEFRVGQTFVEETDRRLLPVTGSPRATLEAERREQRLWRRALRRIRHPRGNKK